MSTLPPAIPETLGSTESPHPARSKSKRLLACVLCQQRKVKCDHNFPCATCVKARVQCVQSVQAPRRRRQQFPEKELLTRVRKYEQLLAQHNISFEPLHPIPQAVGDKNSPVPVGKGSCDSDEEELGTRPAIANGVIAPTHESNKTKVKHMFRSMREEVNQDGSSDDEVQPIIFKKAWDEEIGNSDYLLFGWSRTGVAMYTLHPQPVQVFQLWQLYLDNVNPLLKVTHTPTLQAKIVEATGNILTINPELEALMFGVYSTAISSLSDVTCHCMFGSSKAHLLAQFRLGCQQALLQSRFLRYASRDCLTAFYLYLVSIRPNTTPESLSLMIGVAVRIAQRMGIHNEASLAKLDPLEAEMSRRLWWSLILFDNRIGEMADFQATSLLPVWDCKPLLSVNDSDLRHDMKEPPVVQGKLTDALFAVVRSELGNFVRHTTFHLGYYDPSLRSTNGDMSHRADTEDGETDRLEQTIEAKYLELCDADNPLHFMTIWTTRGDIAKFHLMEHHSRYAGSPLHQADFQREAALAYALRMLDCNTKIVNSPHTQGFNWMCQFNFPFVGYIQTVQYLKWRPLSHRATAAWLIMSDNYHANESLLSGNISFFGILANFVLQAWQAREVALGESGLPLEMPQVVASIKQRLENTTLPADDLRKSGHFGNVSSADIVGPKTFGQDNDVSAHHLGAQDEHSSANLVGLSLHDFQMDCIDWSGINWSMGSTAVNNTDVARSDQWQL